MPELAELNGVPMEADLYSRIVLETHLTPSESQIENACVDARS